MTRRWIRRLPLPALLVLLLGATPGRAGLFNSGIGDAMYYGPYTGGHIYSYNTAYGYGLSFNFADSWRKDPFAYPYGPYPYRPPYPLLPHFRDNATAVPGVIIDQPVPAQLGQLQPITASTQAATLQVTVPPTAEVWIEGQKTTQTGPERTFRSPPLESGKSYLYTVRARWMEAGGAVEQFQAVTVSAGGTANVRFPARRP
jgi:uncharacterized protein (TIGR03000 family)